MARETEIKLKIEDVRAFHRALKRMGARLAGPGSVRVHEENVIFDTPQRIVLTFKQPPAHPAGEGTESAHHGWYKVRDEIELEITDAGSLTKIFEGLGMRGWFRYEKYRTTFKLPAALRWAQSLLIELDETPIGTFMELEGPAEAIDRAAKELGYSPRDYVLKNYLALYAEECRRRNEQPRDMVFAKLK